MLRALTDTSIELELNGHWLIDIAVVDDDGYLADGSPVITVTSPAAVVTTPTVEHVALGHYRTTVTTSTAGRYVATVVAAGYGAVAFAAHVTSVTAAAAFPVLADVKAYIGSNESTSDGTYQDALDAEAAAQRKVCDVPAIYPADLRQALLRRVARNLALRGQPMAVLTGSQETGSLVLPGRDPEVRRLEAPYRRLVQP